jgi:transposase-like protein
MNKKRKFTPEFKSQVVLQLLSGEKNMAELCREHQLTSQMIGNWKQQFLAAAPQAFEKGSDTSAEQEHIAELERMIGRLTMELEIAKKASRLLHGMRDKNGK